jgi:multiple sugar transport system substrate-binding protein
MYRKALHRSSLILAGTASVVMLAAGCASSPTSSPASSSAGSSASGATSHTTITFDYLWTGAEANALQQIIQQFNASQQQITVVGISNPDTQKQLASMSSSTGSFDISDNFGNNVGSWAAKGVLTPLNGYLNAAGLSTSDFVPAAIDQVTYQGQIYSLPIAVHDFELLYNKKEFAAAGIAGPPVTTSQLAADIARLTKVNSSGQITQLGLGNPDTETTMTTLGYAFGGTWDGADGRTPSPQDPGDLAALNFYTQNVTDKYGAAKVARFTAGWGQYGSPQDPFYTGKVAMVIDGEWQPVMAKESAPDFDWGVADIPYPAGDPQLAGTTQLTASTLFIPANAPHKQAAFTFMKYLTSPSAMLKFTLALGNLPARESLLDNPAYDSIPDFSVWLQALKSPNVHSLASQPYSAQYSTDLTTAFTSMMLGSLTPAQAMAQVAGEAKDYGTP